jgi:hypothetical protein
VKRSILFPALALMLSTSAFAQTPPASQPAVEAAKDATLITMHMKQELPEDVFSALGKQAGVRFTAQNNLWARDTLQDPIDFDCENRPFWDVVRELCAQSGIQPYMYGGERNANKRITLQQAYNNQKWDAMPWAISKGCLIQATGFQRNQNVSYGGQQQSQDNASVNIFAYIDPALRVAGYRYNPKATEAVDDLGNSLLLSAKKEAMYNDSNFNTAQGMVIQTGVQLNYPEKAGKKITSLKFNLVLRVADEVVTLTYDKLDEPNVMQTAGDTEITVKSFKVVKQPNQGDRYEMVIHGRSDEQRNDMYSQLAAGQLLDAKGRALNSQGGGGSGGSNGYTVNQTYTRGGNGDDDGNAGPPVKWVITIPTKMRTLTIPVELKDLPLP